MSCNRFKVTTTNALTGNTTAIEFPEGSTADQVMALVTQQSGGQAKATLRSADGSPLTGSTQVPDGAQATVMPNKNVRGAKPSTKGNGGKGGGKGKPAR